MEYSIFVYIILLIRKTFYILSIECFFTYIKGVNCRYSEINSLINILML